MRWRSAGRRYPNSSVKGIRCAFRGIVRARRSVSPLLRRQKYERSIVAIAIDGEIATSESKNGIDLLSVRKIQKGCVCQLRIKIGVLLKAVDHPRGCSIVEFGTFNDAAVEQSQGPDGSFLGVLQPPSRLGQGDPRSDHRQRQIASNRSASPLCGIPLVEQRHERTCVDQYSATCHAGRILRCIWDSNSDRAGHL